MSVFSKSEELRALIHQEVSSPSNRTYMLSLFGDLHAALEHAVLIAEDKQAGTWDDVMKYRELL